MFFPFSYRTSPRAIVVESYSIVAVFDSVALHPLVDILATLDCCGHDVGAAT